MSPGCHCGLASAGVLGKTGGMNNDLASRLQALEDREAIRELIASYGPLADAGAADAIAGLWAEGGSYGVGGMGAATGRTAIAGLIEGPTHQALMAQGCGHLLGPVTIVLDGDQATARGHSVVFRHTNAGFEAWRVAANRWDLVRGEGGWHVSHRENALLDGTETARALFSPPSGHRP